MSVRIACSGLVAAEAGSVASAGFEVLRELLECGYEIDPYSKSSYVYPTQFIEHPCFRYSDCSQPSNVTSRIRETHRDRRYDLALSLRRWAFGKAPGLPVVGWVQGPPRTDSRSVVRHRRSIKRVCGSRKYAKLRAYSLYRASLGRPAFRHTDITICGSHWSADMLVSRYGILATATRQLPYPIDLELFRPTSRTRMERPLELVWIGRVVPRKRLDLFLDARAELIAAGRDIKLTVVGAFPFAEDFRELLEAFPYPERLTYLPGVPRNQVRAILQGAAVLVQPSEEEKFGSSVAEALACGTPVVLGPTNGTGDYMDAEGARFDDYRADAVAGAVSKILDRLEVDLDGTLAQARRASTAHFSVSHVVDRLEPVLNEVLHV